MKGMDKRKDNNGGGYLSERQGVRLSPYLRQELSSICKETGAKASVVIRAALTRFIEDYNKR